MGDLTVDTVFPIGGELSVRRLGFGTGGLVGTGYWGPRHDDPQRSVALLRRAVERGVTLIDTADNYGPDVAEELVARALHPYPAGLVIATKGGVVRTGPDIWHIAGRPEQLRAMCEASLRRLRTDTIDLYQLHRLDPDVPMADQLGTLRELQQAGKIRHIGLDSIDADELTRGAGDHPHRVRTEPLQPAGPRGGGRTEAVREAGHGVPALVPAGPWRTGRRRGRHARHGRRPARRHHRPDRAGLAPAPLPRTAAHPWHGLPRPSGREPGGGPYLPYGGGLGAVGGVGVDRRPGDPRTPPPTASSAGAPDPWRSRRDRGPVPRRRAPRLSAIRRTSMSDAVNSTASRWISPGVQVRSPRTRSASSVRSAAAPSCAASMLSATRDT